MRNTLYSYLIDKDNSEMKRIQKDYTVKIHISWIFSTYQRNEEDQLVEKLTDEEIDEMILEVDIHDT